MKIIKKNKSFTITDFSIVDKYKYTEYSRNDEDTGRTYNVGEEKIPSVTTILSKTQSQEKIESLDKWREKVGYQEAARITNQAASRGTEMHYVLEQYCRGKGYLNLSEKGSLPRMMAHTVVDNLDKLSEVWGSEVNLQYSDYCPSLYPNPKKIAWAGCTDLVGLYDDQPTIIDFKQANKPKREEWIEDYYYQIAAYAIAHKHNHGPITQGLICVCTKDLVYQEFKMSEDMILEYEHKWFERTYKYYKKVNTSSPKV